jgi:hypothetical protein
MFAWLIVTAFGFQAVSAQFPISIPKIPKIKKDSPKEPEQQGQAQKNESSNSDDYDKEAFREIRFGNERYLQPYLECYAKKHNLETSQVGNSDRYYGNNSIMEQTLKGELPKLAEIESLLKSKLKFRPDTNQDYFNNPAIWDEISTNRDQYFKCVIDTANAPDPNRQDYVVGVIDKLTSRMNEWDTINQAMPFSFEDGDDFAWYAVSPSKRTEWMTKLGYLDYRQGSNNKIDPALDSLNDAMKKKLPSYVPNPKNYVVASVAEQKMMKDSLKKDLTKFNIFKIGLWQSNWLIDKNDLGIPKSRYKQGFIWVRDTQADYPYCEMYMVNIIQSYAGGGTYGASYGYYSTYEFAGCPAGK